MEDSMMLLAFIGVCVAVGAAWYFFNNSSAKKTLDVNKDGQVNLDDAKAAVAEVKAEVKEAAAEVKADVKKVEQAVTAAAAEVKEDVKKVAEKVKKAAPKKAAAPKAKK